MSDFWTGCPKLGHTNLHCEVIRSKTDLFQRPKLMSNTFRQVLRKKITFARHEYGQVGVQNQDKIISSKVIASRKV